MMPFRNNTKAKSAGYGTSYGVTNGNVRHDNRVINVHNSTCGHVVTTVCLTVIMALLIILIAVIIWFFCMKDPRDQRQAFDAEKHELKIGIHGGVYFVHKDGTRQYIDREHGIRIYNEQQKRKKELKEK